MGNNGRIMRYYEQFWGIMENSRGIMGTSGAILNLGCHFLCCLSLFFIVVWPFVSIDMSDFHRRNNVLYVRLSCINKVLKR